MRFEIRYPNGEKHEVELQGTVAILGRDPSCDLVINDVKCSRRHAVMEAGPDGLAVRDSGSANGVFVNGRKTDRSPLKEGDEVKLGDVVLRVLPEEVIGTVVMAPDEYGGMSTAPPTAEMPAVDPDGTIAPGVGFVPPPAPPLPYPAPPPPIAAVPTAPMAPPPGPGTLPLQPPTDVPPRPAAPALPPPPSPPSLRAPSAGAPLPPMGGAPPPPTTAPAAKKAVAVPESAPGRPLTVTILAVLWGVCIPLNLLAAIVGLVSGTGAMRFVLPALYLVLTGLSGVMGWGLWTLKPWARMAQVVVAGLGILVACPFAVASIGTILYLLRPAAVSRFAGGSDADPKETLFAGVVGAGVLLGAIGMIGVSIAFYFANAASSIPVN
ncbi:MAG: FHA domain-containing protein [Vicinamibacteria bacterium]